MLEQTQSQDTERHVNAHLLNLARRAESKSSSRGSFRVKRPVSVQVRDTMRMPIFWEQHRRESQNDLLPVAKRGTDPKRRSSFFKCMLQEEAKVNINGKSKQIEVLNRFSNPTNQRIDHNHLNRGLVEEFLYKKMRQPQSPSNSEYLQAKMVLPLRRSLFSQASFKVFLMD